MLTNPILSLRSLGVRFQIYKQHICFCRSNNTRPSLLNIHEFDDMELGLLSNMLVNSQPYW
jgi:hypothetical protein